VYSASAVYHGTIIRRKMTSDRSNFRLIVRHPTALWDWAAIEQGNGGCGKLSTDAGQALRARGRGVGGGVRRLEDFRELPLSNARFPNARGSRTSAR
jgi:hypothetical protein